MIRPSRKLNNLRSSLKGSSDLLALVVEEQSDRQSSEDLLSASVDDPGNEYLSKHSSPSPDKPTVLLSVGQVFTDYLITFGQLIDLYEAAELLWPNKADLVVRSLDRYDPRAIFRDHGGRYLQAVEALTAKLLSDLNQSFRQWGYELTPRITATDFGDLMCSYRDFVAFGRGATCLNDNLGSKFEEAASHARDSCSKLYEAVQAYGDPDGVAQQMRRYAGYEYLLRGVTYDDPSTEELRDLLLKMAAYGGRNKIMIDVDGLIGQALDQNVDDHLLKPIKRIFEGLGRILEDDEYQGLGPIIDDWGGMSTFGPISVIPGIGRVGKCQEILLAMASGGGASSGSLQDVMRRLRSHLIRCSGKTRVVIVLTDHWDLRVLKESKADITAHRNNGVVFISGLVSGPNINAQPLPF
ncbi:hypothetical protein [Ruegeria sp. HKCCD7318]|uniref:hypothetical protein n=1 Tax=Ruegeria sp. HKCCD7318 TaxID=2683014 RepID=UPI00149130FE|nr:hypothetical protein [Ruegeria sp. HKCCD7318]NOE32302.1 hypothetical protein [Ruegeria sp. HKCCD7318]